MMVRGRRKGRTPSTKVTAENTKAIGNEFQGKLSHASPKKITSFYSPKVKSSPKMPPLLASPVVSILQPTNNIIKKSPHRIEMTNIVNDAKKPRNQQKATTEPPKTTKLTDYFPVRRSVRKTKKTVLEEKQKSIEEAVLSKKEDGLAVHMFLGKGRGIISTKEFKRGDFVVEYAGELISMEEARIREGLYSQDQNTGCYMYYFNHKNTQYCIDATRETPRLGRLVNHSRNGNLMTKTITVNGEPRLVLLAKEDIGPGTELTYDYGDRSKESLRYHPWLAT